MLLCSKTKLWDASGFFLDEKIFSVDAKMNRKNNHWLARDPEDVPIIAKTNFSASVYVPGVVSNKDHVLPHFFQKKEAVTKEMLRPNPESFFCKMEGIRRRRYRREVPRLTTAAGA